MEDRKSEYKVKIKQLDMGLKAKGKQLIDHIRNEQCA